jgi:hypothetical protein
MHDLALFEYQHACAFTYHETVAILIPRAGCRGWSSFLEESARIEENPATERAVTAASVPPQIIASASPLWIIRKASRIPCAPVVHAVAQVRFGPIAP